MGFLKTLSPQISYEAPSKDRIHTIKRNVCLNVVDVTNIIICFVDGKHEP